MRLGKKAIQAYILALLIISSIMAVLLVSVISIVYTPDHSNCEMVEIEILNSCRDANIYKIEIMNNGDDVVRLNINGQDSIENILSPKTSKEFRINRRDGDRAVIIPAISEGGILYLCRGKTERIQTEIIGIC